MYYTDPRPEITYYMSSGTLKLYSLMGQVFSIGTVAAYSAKYSALVAYKILKLFQY